MNYKLNGSINEKSNSSMNYKSKSNKNDFFTDLKKQLDVIWSSSRAMELMTAS